MTPAEPSTTQASLNSSKPEKDPAVVVQEKEVRGTPPLVDQDGDTTMGRNFETELGDKSPRRLRSSRTSRHSEESLLHTLQDRIAEAENLQNETRSLRKEKERLEGRIRELEYHTKWQEGAIDDRHEEAQQAKAKADQIEKKARAEVSKAKEKVKEAEEFTNALQLAVEEYEKTMKRLNQEIKDLKSRIKKKEETSKKVSEQLHDAQNHIFRLQPRRTQITDTEAQEEFEDLYNGIKRWVENRLEGILNQLDDGYLQTRTCPAEDAKRILILIGARAREDFASDQSDEYHVVAIIMEYLCRSIFHRDFYCSLGPGQTPTTSEDQTIATINMIEKAMSRADRGRKYHFSAEARLTYIDISHCLDWRFEALNALVSQPEFQEKRATLERYLVEDLFRLVRPLIPAGDPQELMESVNRSMIKPALDLAHRLQLSTTVFSVRWTPYNHDLESGRVDETRVDFSQYTCLNLLERGKLVKTSGEIDSNAPLRVRYLFDVCPGLYCEVLEDGQFSRLKTLSKPKILVAASIGNRILPTQGQTIFLWLDHCAKILPRMKAAPTVEPAKKPKKGLSRFRLG